MKSVEITLYDIFGYFIPGCVALVALYLIAWRLVLPEAIDLSNVSALGWAIVAGTAYVVGHALQAFSNLFYRIFWANPEQRLLADAFVAPAHLLKVAQNAGKRVAYLPENDDVDFKTLYDIMDHYVQQHGKTTSRDIYIYREGFYRGLSMGFLLLAIGSFLHIGGRQEMVSAFGVVITLSGPRMGFVGGLSIVMAFLFAFRYQRFIGYRVKNCLFSFLALCNSADEGGSKC